MTSAELVDALIARAYTSKNLPVMNTATEDTTQQVSSAGSAGRVDAGEVYNAQIRSTLILDKPSTSRSTSPSKVDPESSRTSFESVGYGGEKYIHPSDNGTTISNPTNAGDRLNLRAASLAISPSIDEGFGGPSVASDTGRRNFTVPIATKPRLLAQKINHATDVREPAPTKQLPNINETLGNLAPLRHGDVPSAPASVKYIDVSSAPMAAAPGEHGLSVNPYVRRADDIGPRHGIPGVGHIGALLTPPGWRIGDEPITDREAEWLYDQARAMAAKTLDVSVNRRENMTTADELQRNAEEVERWQRQLRIDTICLAERKCIYSRWQELKALRSMQAQQQRPVQAQGRVVPSPVHPLTLTSIHAYQRHQQAQLPSSPLSPYASDPPRSAGALRNRLQSLQQGLHLPERSPMSPSFLDPNLVPQTLDSIYAHYRANHITIMQMHGENEDFLTCWTAKFGVTRPQGLPVTPMPQYMNGNGQQARPITNIQYGHEQGQLCPHHEQLRLQKQGQDAPTTQVQEPNNGLFHKQHLGPGSFCSQQQEPFRASFQVGRIPLLEGAQASADRLPERTVERVGTPQSQMVGFAGSSRNALVWPQERVEHPYAPTTTASEGRQKTGSGPKSKNTELINGAQQEIRRGKKPTINAKNGFSVSADQARRLIALGVNDSRGMGPGPVRAGSLPAGTLTRHASSSSATFSNPQSSNGVAGSGGSTIVRTQSRLGAGSKSRVNSPSPSVESLDDPNDTTYPQRKITTPHTNPPGRKAAVTGNKRKSGKAESAPTLKRARMNLAHMVKEDA